MSFVDSRPPPLRYQRSGVGWIILPFLAAGVSAIRAFSRTPSLLELSPPMAKGTVDDKENVRVDFFDTFKADFLSVARIFKLSISWLEFQGLIQERKTRLSTKGCHFSFIKEGWQGLFVRAFIFSSDFLNALV